MRRITPEEVLAAYRETGLKPEMGFIFTDHNTACALGAMSRSKFSGGAIYSTYGTIDLLQTEGYRYRYLEGIHCGFDHPDKDWTIIEGNRDFLIGAEDGAAINRLVFSEFGATNE